MCGARTGQVFSRTKAVVALQRIPASARARSEMADVPLGLCLHQEGMRMSRNVLDVRWLNGTDGDGGLFEVTARLEETVPVAIVFETYTTEILAVRREENRM